EAGLAGPDVREVAQDAVDQVEEAGHGLGAGEPAAGHDKGEPAAPLGRVGLVVGLLEPPQDVVAEPAGVLPGGRGGGGGRPPGPGGGRGLAATPGRSRKLGTAPRASTRWSYGRASRASPRRRWTTRRSGSTPRTSARRNPVRG